MWQIYQSHASTCAINRVRDLLIHYLRQVERQKYEFQISGMSRWMIGYSISNSYNSTQLGECEFHIDSSIFVRYSLVLHSSTVFRIYLFAFKSLHQTQSDITNSNTEVYLILTNY